MQCWSIASQQKRQLLPATLCREHGRIQCRTQSRPVRWDLGGSMDPTFTELAANIEAKWQASFAGSLQTLDVDQDFLKCNSANSSSGRAQHDGVLPGSHMRIENRLFTAANFRKLHLELALQGKGLQVLHCVLYPEKEACFPIFSFDMVASQACLPSLCIVDACPVAEDLSLPKDLELVARELQQKHGLASNRTKPAWGSSIFSDVCLLMKPKDSPDVASFLSYATDFHAAFLRWATSAAREHDGGDSFRGQGRFCEFQRQNQKTRRMLEAAFGTSYAAEYIDKILFDAPL